MADPKPFMRYTLHAADGTQIAGPFEMEDCAYTAEIKEEEVGDFLHRSKTGRFTIIGTHRSD